MTAHVLITGTSFRGPEQRVSTGVVAEHILALRQRPAKAIREPEFDAGEAMTEEAVLSRAQDAILALLALPVPSGQSPEAKLSATYACGCDDCACPCPHSS